jgi:hypothetical protein
MATMDEIRNEFDEIRNMACKISSKGLKDDTLYEAIKKNFNDIEKKNGVNHWKDNMVSIVRSKQEAIEAATSMIWYHGGVDFDVVASGVNEGAYVVLSKGYKYYMNEN